MTVLMNPRDSQAMNQRHSHSDSKGRCLEKQNCLNLLFSMRTSKAPTHRDASWRLDIGQLLRIPAHQSNLPLQSDPLALPILRSGMSHWGFTCRGPTPQSAERPLARQPIPDPKPRWRTIRKARPASQAGRRRASSAPRARIRECRGPPLTRIDADEDSDSTFRASCRQCLSRSRRVRGAADMTPTVAIAPT
jgi:hypothetical protein